jgi:hypothetical protein
MIMTALNGITYCDCKTALLCRTRSFQSKKLYELKLYEAATVAFPFFDEAVLAPGLLLIPT